MASPSPTSLNVGLSSWIIQDGNYPDCKIGQQASFALEFYVETPRPSTKREKAIHPLRSAQYDFSAQVVFADSEVWVLDTGRFLAFDQRPPPSFAQPGAWVEGELYLGIDPFFYFEYLHQKRALPSLTYTWLIESILAETTPWIEAKFGDGRTYSIRDVAPESFTPIQKTDAWNDDGGNGHYILTCRQLSGPTRPSRPGSHSP